MNSIEEYNQVYDVWSVGNAWVPQSMWYWYLVPKGKELKGGYNWGSVNDLVEKKGAELGEMEGLVYKGNRYK